MSNFNKFKSNETVRDGLEDIEDKLRERGFLVKATGDTEAEVTIKYDEWGEEGDRGPYLIISISSAAPKKKLREDHFEAISDYVNDKISEISEEWSEEISEALSDIFGQVVLLNEKQVY